MPEETVIAESSPAPAAEPTLEVPRSGPEYDNWRKTGQLPEKPKPAEAAPAQDPAEPRSDSAPETQTQEKPKPQKLNAEGRIAQLEATIEKLWEQDEPDTIKIAQLESTVDRIKERAGIKRKTAPAPVAQPQEEKPKQSQAPQNYADWRKTFKPSQWIEQYGKDNPEATYEDANAAMADYLYEAQRHFDAIERRSAEQRSAVDRSAQEAVKRYGNEFYGVKDAFIQATMTKEGQPLIPVEVLNMIGGSEVMADLVYTLAEDPDALAEFVNASRINPYDAARRITRLEDAIREELDKGSSANRNQRGQFTAKTAEPPAPAKRGPESAPEPPIEIGSRGSGPMDESERALKDAERGSSKAFRAWKEAEDRKELARRRGA